jgi:hypothetical protein
MRDAAGGASVRGVVPGGCQLQSPGCGAGTGLLYVPGAGEATGAVLVPGCGDQPHVSFLGQRLHALREPRGERTAALYFRKIAGVDSAFAKGPARILAAATRPECQD